MLPRIQTHQTISLKNSKYLHIAIRPRMNTALTSAIKRGFDFIYSRTDPLAPLIQHASLAYLPHVSNERPRFFDPA